MNTLVVMLHLLTQHMHSIALHSILGKEEYLLPVIHQKTSCEPDMEKAKHSRCQLLYSQGRGARNTKYVR